MRILLASEHGERIGGAETYLEGVGKALLNTAGVEVALMTVQSPTRRPLRFDGRRWSVSDLGLRGALEEARRFSPEAVYAHGFRDSAAEMALLQDYPCDLYAHGYYGICATGTKTWHVSGVRPCPVTFGPMCLIRNYSHGCGVVSPKRLLRSYRRQEARRSSLSQYRNIYVASRHMRAEYHRMGVRATLLPYPCEEEPLTAKPARRGLALRVAFVGRVEPNKGVLLLPEAVAVATERVGQELTLVVMGTGAGLDRLRVEAARWGVPLDAPGWVNPTERRERLLQVDALLVPSLWPEPFGLVGPEAGALGVPSVAFDVGGIRDWLERSTGVLVTTPRLDARSLGAGLADLLTSDNGERWQAAREAAWSAARSRTMEDHVSRLVPLLGGATR